MVSRHTASLKASTLCRTPAPQVSRVSDPASATSSATIKRMRPSRTLRLEGLGAACFSILSAAFMTRSTTFMPSPLRSVIELRCPRCQAPSSIRRPTLAPVRTSAKGRAKGAPTRGELCATCPCLLLVATRDYPPACTCHAIRNHTRALYSVSVREGVFSEVRMPRYPLVCPVTLLGFLH